MLHVESPGWSGSDTIDGFILRSVDSTIGCTAPVIWAEGNVPPIAVVAILVVVFVVQPSPIFVDGE